MPESDVLEKVVDDHSHLLAERVLRGTTRGRNVVGGSGVGVEVDGCVVHHDGSFLWSGGLLFNIVIPDSVGILQLHQAGQSATCSGHLVLKCVVDPIHCWHFSYPWIR